MSGIIDGLSVSSPYVLSMAAVQLVEECECGALHIAQIGIHQNPEDDVDERSYRHD